MPYIKQDRRDDFEDPLAETIEAFGPNVAPGDLNYVITKLAIAYYEIHGEKYATFATLTGVIENVKQELYRRAVSKFEDEKLQQNGDVY